LPDTGDNSVPQSRPRGWSIIAAGLLLLALAIVVLYTSRAAFSSPLAMVVVAAIGLAALLLQLRLRKDLQSPIHTPLWLNVLGLLFALAVVFGDLLRLKPAPMMVAALGAVLCFGVSGIVVFQALRKRKI
jgi:drug/metabolite transporter (DMT)-like permease